MKVSRKRKTHANPMATFRAAAKYMVQLSPWYGMERNALEKEPRAAPKVLMAYRTPIREPALPASFSTYCARTGKVAPMMDVGMMSNARAMKNLYKASETPESYDAENMAA